MKALRRKKLLIRDKKHNNREDLNFEVSEAGTFLLARVFKGVTFLIVAVNIKIQ